jgi:hypothetical protein
MPTCRQAGGRQAQYQCKAIISAGGSEAAAAASGGLPQTQQTAEQCSAQRCHHISATRFGSHLSKVARVVLVHGYPVVVLATGHTAAARVLAVLADTAMAGAHVAALLPVLAQACTQGSGSMCCRWVAVVAGPSPQQNPAENPSWRPAPPLPAAASGACWPLRRALCRCCWPAVSLHCAQSRSSGPPRLHGRCMASGHRPAAPLPPLVAAWCRVVGARQSSRPSCPPAASP